VPPRALVIRTPDGEHTLPGDRPAVVGRGREADVVVRHPRVSRRHVALEPTPDGWLARDLSTNGMWRDGAQVAVVPIGDGPTRLRLGGAEGPELTFTVPTPPVSEPQADELETRLAPSAGGGTVPGQTRPGAAEPAVPATPTAPTPRRPPRWLTTVPTFVWLFAAAFAIGALVAVS
jgi:hypothetical protein